jgi:UDP-N-acetylglucosamine diphosphorylase/glucosamine-1-phosphate N-acetyltransferase
MDIVVFEDDLAARLHPISLARPTYAITCGGYRLMDWLTLMCPSVQGLVRPHLQAIQSIDYPHLAERADGGSVADCLVVNSRLVPSLAMFEQLQSLVSQERAVVVRQNNQLAATWLPAGCGITPLQTRGEFSAFERALVETPRLELDLALFEYPHDIIRYNIETLVPNLEHRLRVGDYREIADGVFAAAGATLSPHVVTESDEGPIVLEQGASVGPFSLLRGPVSLGANARNNEHAVIKDHVSVGHTTKIGGEVEATVIEPYSNKQHHGFLGHSYIGSWINLGAGTCNSDLKNTYGNVNIQYGDQKTETGMQFVGCVMGDYAKTAINTGIFTGKIIGVCSMLYGFVTTNVPSFVNYARLFGQVSELPAEVMISTQRRMFTRRNVEQRPCDSQLIRDMFELTRFERQSPDDQLML